MLSNDEIKTAQRLIAQYRRFARHWKVLRWGALLIALYALGIAGFSYYQMEKMTALGSSSEFILDPTDTVREIEHSLNIRFALLRAELQTYIGVIVFGSVGLLLLITVLWCWNRQGSLVPLKAKLLEIALEKEHLSKKQP